MKARWPGPRALARSRVTLISIDGDNYLYSFSGTESGLIVGQILADPIAPYTRKVITFTEDAAKHTVKVLTEQVGLAECFEKGDFHAAQHLSKEVRLDGTTIYKAQDGSIEIQVVSGVIKFDSELTLAGNIQSKHLVAFDSAIAGTVELDMTLRATYQTTGDFGITNKLISIPIPIPIEGLSIPAEFELVLDFNIGYEAHLQAEGSVTAGFTSSRTVVFGTALRNGTWTENHGQLSKLTGITPTWEINGSARVVAFVQPKISLNFDVFGFELAGISADLKPYLEVDGNASLMPGQAGVDVTAYAGLSSTLALDLRFVGEKDFQLFDLRDRIGHLDKTTQIGSQPQTIPNMVWIPAGSFTMGSPDTEAERSSSEGPLTQVTISQGFWMGKFAVTQEEYESLMSNNPSYFSGDRSGAPYHDQDYGLDPSRPVESVSWYDAVAYCAVLTTRERNAGRLPAGYVYRLPTEAEWEYACRAGTTTAFHYGRAVQSGMANFYGYYEYDASLGTIYNPSGTFLKRTTSVGSYAYNAWGLYDVHGNVWQWCQDWWSESLPGGSVTDPQGGPTATMRVIRGGGWGDDGRFCRSAFRWHIAPGGLGSDTGFRVVLAPTQTVPNMIFVPPGTFTMGSPASEAAREAAEGPQTRVTISQGFWMSKYEVTQGQYASVMGSNPSHFTADLTEPVETVSWNDAVAYCAALTQKEAASGHLPSGYRYRLPTEAEWEYACRAGATTTFHYGDELRSGMANFDGRVEYLVGDPYHNNPGGIYLGVTSSVGGYSPNAWGLYDMHGNVWEWCSDRWASSLPGGSLTDPTGPSSGFNRVLRGGSWNNRGLECRAAFRNGGDPGLKHDDIGFRVVLAPVQTIPNMVWIPPGTFTMGSPENEPARLSSEGPQTSVTISRGFWMGKYETKQSEFLAMMGINPSYFNGLAANGTDYGLDLNRPVEQVTWTDAMAYCAALTTRERNAGRLPAGYSYRLPTEAEWEYTCRAGTTKAFSTGSALRSGAANFDGHHEYPPCDGLTDECYNPSGTFLGQTSSTGSYNPNAWGLYDMHGNVWEWCQDWEHGTYPGGSVTDPKGPTTGDAGRVIRGGAWYFNAWYCRAAFRNGLNPNSAMYAVGFRTVLAPEETTEQGTYASSFRHPVDGDWTINCNSFWSCCVNCYHLGEDVGRAAGTPVFAPANGVVRHTKQRTAYGNVIILEHNTGTEILTTVMGHLRSDIQVSVGDKVSKGQLLGYLGDSSQNGGYAPHMHFGIHKGPYAGDDALGCGGGWLYAGYSTNTCVKEGWYVPSDFVITHGGN